MILPLLATTLSLTGFTPIREPGAPLDLSISQEADAAIDRAQRWLIPRIETTRLQTAGTNTAFNAWLLTYATTRDPLPPPDDPTPLLTLLPPAAEIPTLSETWLTIPPEAPITNRYLFSAQRALAPLRGNWPGQEKPLPDWREEITRRIINTQRITPDGSGHWPTPDETLWAILTLRALLNESPEIIEKPKLEKEGTTT